MMKSPANILICCIFSAVLAGCVSASPVSRFYTPNSTVVPSNTPRADYSVSVGPISIPAVVDRQQIVVMTGPNQVSINEFDRWASPLKDEIGHTVVEDLTALLGTTKVTQFPQSISSEASYRIVIDILRFDSEQGKSAILDALWTVSHAESRKSYRGRTTHTEQVQDNNFANLVAAHSRALGRLSTDIAQKIKEMATR